MSRIPLAFLLALSASCVSVTGAEFQSSATTERATLVLGEAVEVSATHAEGFEGLSIMGARVGVRHEVARYGALSAVASTGLGLHAFPDALEPEVYGALSARVALGRGSFLIATVEQSHGATGTGASVLLGFGWAF